MKAMVSISGAFVFKAGLEAKLVILGILLSSFADFIFRAAFVTRLVI